MEVGDGVNRESSKGEEKKRNLRKRKERGGEEKKAKVTLLAKGRPRSRLRGSLSETPSRRAPVSQGVCLCAQARMAPPKPICM